MIEIKSTLEGKQAVLSGLKSKLEGLGYTVGGNWDYDHGYFDYKLDEGEEEQYLRIPITALDGDLEQENSRVELGRPFMLSHEYKTDVDVDGNVGNVSASLNQFREPSDKDAPFPKKFIEMGVGLVKNTETELLNEKII